jgi:hypothetical protein
MTMQEKLLQFIWQYNLYRPDILKTTEGEPVQVIHPGRFNTDAGPDFHSARIRIGKILLAGNVELHVRTSDWQRHGHQHDHAYSNIILHVVYEHDTQTLPGGFAVLPLKEQIPPFVLDQYTNLIQTTAPLPCAQQLHRVKNIVRESWLSRLLIERLEHRFADWTDELAQAGQDWRTLLYWRMAANFGFKVNSTAFLLMAQSLPLQHLNKQHNLLQIEALLFGQAGMLEAIFEDEYPQSLQQEYKYLRQKYQLQPIAAHLWKFMRLRPANFPTIRIAQFAALVHQSLHLFTRIGDAKNIEELIRLLDITASSYWDVHYRFEDDGHKATPKKLGTASIYSIIMNTIAPVQFLYYHEQGMVAESEQALQLLEALPAEDNNVLRLWKEHHWPAQTAGQSQALIQLYNHYCSRKRCLECSIGLSIIRSRPDK